MALSLRHLAGFAASFGAVGLALAALGVSIVETRIMREEQHMSVWPRLMAATSRDQGGFNVMLQNKGLGPAQIRVVRVGTPGAVHTEWSSAFAALLGRATFNFSFSTIGGAVLMPGEIVHAVTVQRGPLADSLHAAAENLALDICYCSAYEDCWWLTDPRVGAARSHQSVAPVEACVVPDEEAFQM